MRETLSDALLPKHGESLDHIEMARRDLRKNLPRRFYQCVSLSESSSGFQLELDGKSARTPARHPLCVRHRAVIDLLIGEWDAQKDVIDPALMPVTRLVNSALDGVEHAKDEVRADLLKYAGSDLICYRADGPQGLVEAQNASWDKVLAHIHDIYGVRFMLAQGVGFVAQPASTLARLEDALAGIDDALVLAALHALTTLTGSVLITLSHYHGALDIEAAWSAAHVDEDFQMRQWGGDDEALHRRAQRFADAKAAAQLLASCAP